MHRTVTRRRFLATATGSVALTGLAGCLGSGSSSGDADTPEDGESASGGADTPPNGTSSLTHASAADLQDEPRLGPPLGESDGVIVAFEDPSCPACRRFEENTFPTLKSDLVDPGKVTFYYRTFPHVQAWAEAATHVLEATYADSAEAFWTMKDHYYAEQDAFSIDNVYQKSRTFLSSETGADAEAVVQAAENEKYQDRIQADMQVVRDAGVDSTPSFFLFRGTEFVSKVVGNQSVDVFANALGVSR